jgi:hypothetical protein
VRADPMDGVPCMRELRIPVATIVWMVAEGMSTAEIVEAYPDLESQAGRCLTAAVGRATPGSPMAWGSRVRTAPLGAKLVQRPYLRHGPSERR